MKFLKCAIFICLGIFLGNAQGFDGDLEKIETVNGRLYEKIFILSGDETGLTFRHEAGIAKVDYSELPMNLRMLFEPAEKVDAPEADPQEETEFIPLLDFALQFRYSPVYRPKLIPAPVCRDVVWRSHWPRYNPAHRLVDPFCRELALRDFLYTTGLVMPPCEIHSIQISSNKSPRRYFW
ncbi:MAG: hypothetical protein CMO55_12910 [Verrucomicrobiales bacterium]|nr:hypothetical protein [Verrucomicrobiales bacterium]